MISELQLSTFAVYHPLSGLREVKHKRKFWPMLPTFPPPFRLQSRQTNNFIPPTRITTEIDSDRNLVAIKC